MPYFTVLCERLSPDFKVDIALVSLVHMVRVAREGKALLQQSSRRRIVLGQCHRYLEERRLLVAMETVDTLLHDDVDSEYHVTQTILRTAHVSEDRIVQHLL